MCRQHVVSQPHAASRRHLQGVTRCSVRMWRHELVWRQRATWRHRGRRQRVASTCLHGLGSLLMWRHERVFRRRRPTWRHGTWRQYVASGGQRGPSTCRQNVFSGVGRNAYSHGRPPCIVMQMFVYMCTYIYKYTSIDDLCIYIHISGLCLKKG